MPIVIAFLACYYVIVLFHLGFELNETKKDFFLTLIPFYILIKELSKAYKKLK
jgi:hypothetical protein